MSPPISPEEFTEKLRVVFGDQLVTVALYGSAAIDDLDYGYSDINLLIVLHRIGLEELRELAPLVSEWSCMGNPPPLLFAYERLLNSSQVFPIELLDIKENHRILYGRNVLMALPISQSNLQFQLEHELKGKLIDLRENYLLAVPDWSEVMGLMLQTLSSFQVLLKAALRFYEVNIPLKKREAVRALARHVFFDLSIFEKLQAMRDGAEDLPSVPEEIDALFACYLETIEQTADLISSLGRRHLADR